MRIAHYLAVAVLFSLAATRWTQADPPTASPNDNPALQVDPDGVPLSVLRPDTRPSPGEIEVERKRQEQAALNRDWLLRGYEKQLQDHTDGFDDGEANLYYHLSSNRDLARLAGLPVLDLESQHVGEAYRAGTAPSQGPVTLRPDTGSAAANYSLLPNSPFKPLITPLSSPDALGLHNFYSSMTTPFFGVPKRPAAPAATPSEDTSDMETPGLVAAEKNPLPDSASSDLTLDLLPGETVEQARARQDNGSLQLSVPMDANELHKAQAAALNVPSLPGATQAGSTTPNSAVIPVAPIADPEAPMPVNKTPPINPIRSPIANPFDILNR